MLSVMTSMTSQFAGNKTAIKGARKIAIKTVSRIAIKIANKGAAPVAIQSVNLRAAKVEAESRVHQEFVRR